MFNPAEKLEEENMLITKSKQPEKVEEPETEKVIINDSESDETNAN